MILIDIGDDTGFSHYDVLGLKQADVACLDAKKAADMVNTAAKHAKKKYYSDAQRGDQAAEERMTKINQALETLKNPEKRQKYDEELQQGKGQTLAVLQIQPAAAPFFRDRAARFRVLERGLRQAGLGRRLSPGLD